MGRGSESGRPSPYKQGSHGGWQPPGGLAGWDSGPHHLQHELTSKGQQEPKVSTRSTRRLVIATLVLFTAGLAFAAEPAKKDDTAKLDEYQVGGNKKLPKNDTAVTKVERPKASTDAAIQFEKPMIEIAPMVVAPMQVSPPPPVAAAPAVTAPAKAPASKVTNAAPAPAPVRQASPAGATAALPVAPKPAPSPAGALPQASGSGDVSLVPISTPAPEYPREASMAGTTGFVVVTFTLNLEGVPQDIAILESSPPRVFDQSARRAVARWRFQPVVVNGQAVERKVQRRIDFK
jgi:TonB family protein